MSGKSAGRWLVGVGASTMAGAKDPEGGFFARITRRPEAQAKYAEFLNLGVGGWVTRQMVEGTTRLPKDIDHDVVVILGCNDLPRKNDGNPSARATLETYSSNLAKLFSIVKGQRSLFATSFAVSEEKTGVNTNLFEQYMDAATEQARQAGYEIWDLYRETKSIAKEYWADDCLHFGPAGHELIVQGVLKRMLK